MIKSAITTRPGHPDFLDLDWDTSIREWNHPRLMDLPKGISRHEVRFVGYDEGIYAIKELPRGPAANEYQKLRFLESKEGPAVQPVGYVEREWVDPSEEWSTAVITRYLNHSFSYRELLSGPGFGARRNQMLDGFAGLLVELHILGLFWGDCSLSNVLYRFDADSILTTLVDSETAEVHVSGLSRGQREHDLDIMITNVAGGMADIAAAADKSFDEADLALGEDIAERYWGLWDALHRREFIGPNERYLITERLAEINGLGFEVDDVALTTGPDRSEVSFSFHVGRRRFHSNRLRELTGIWASEKQAAQILADLFYYLAGTDHESASKKAVGAVRWRVGVFESLLDRIRELGPHAGDPIQAYCDFLHHRFAMSRAAGFDVGNETAFTDWADRGQPGYDID